MTIFEQILAGLQQKFAGVDTATLTRIATKKAEGVTDETKVTSIVEGISFQDVMQNYGDFRAGQAQTSAVSNYEKKHRLKDGKPIEDPEEKKDEKKDEKRDEVPAWAKRLFAAYGQNSRRPRRFSRCCAEKAQAQRNSQISEVAKKYGIPEFMLKDRNIPENTDLDTYFKDMKQDMSNSGFKIAQAPETAEQKQDKEASEFAKMIEADTKQIVEQKNK